MKLEACCEVKKYGARGENVRLEDIGRYDTKHGKSIHNDVRAE